MNEIALFMMPAVLGNVVSDELLQAQAKAWTVGGAVIGTLIGIGVGLVWFLLTRRKSDKSEDKTVKKKVKQTVQKKEVQVAQASTPVKSMKAKQPPKAVEAIKLILLCQDQSGKHLMTTIQDQVILGRSPERAQLVIQGDDTVSGVHCKIYRDEDVLIVTDLASTNGTFVNGNRVGQVMPLKAGDSLKIGLHMYKVQY